MTKRIAKYIKFGLKIMEKKVGSPLCSQTLGVCPLKGLKHETPSAAAATDLFSEHKADTHWAQGGVTHLPAGATEGVGGGLMSRFASGGWTITTGLLITGDPKISLWPELRRCSECGAPCSTVASYSMRGGAVKSRATVHHQALIYAHPKNLEHKNGGRNSFTVLLHDSV